MLNSRLPLALALLAPLALFADAQEKPAGAGEKNVLRLGSLAPEGTPWSEQLERLKAEIERASGGEIRVKIFLNGRAGDEPEMLKKVAGKKLDGGGFTSTGLAGVVPEISLLELPFLFEDEAEADHVMDKVVRDEMAKLLAAKGLHLYCWAVNGWADFGSTARPVLSLADVKASKPYARDAAARTGFWRALGAEPTIVGVPEVAAALRSGKVDLYDTTPLFATAARWYETTKHWTDSNHVYQPAAIVFDLAWWNGLPDAVRKALEALAPDLQADARKAVRGLDAGLLDGMRKQGVTVHALGSSERAAMKQAAAKLAGELAEKGAFPRELHARVEKALADLRAARAPKADPVADKLAASDAHSLKRPSMRDLLQGEFEIQEALRLAPKSYEATWRMARMQLFLGRSGPEAQRLSKYEKAIEWSKKAIELDGGRVEGHYWLAVAYGLFGETKGITSSLFLVDDMQEELEKANKIDSSFEGAGPPRVLGRLYFKLPWAAGGSNAKAIEYLRQAVKLAPGHPFNYTYLAEVLIDEDEEAEAKQVLDKVPGLSVPPAWAPEHKESVEEARKLLGKL